MSERLDEAIQSHFSDRCSPSPERKAALREKLERAARRRKLRRNWAIALYAALLSAALVVATWMLMGASIVFFALALFCAFSIIGSMAITVICQREGEKGGDPGAVSDR